MDDKDFITSIRDQCNTQLGGGGGSQQPSAPVATVATKPAPFTDLGTGNQDPRKIQVTPGMVVGAAFTIAPGPVNARYLRWFGNPGQFWKHNSWAIFDSGGGRVFGEDNATVVGTLGYGLDQTGPLGKLGAGQYTIGVATDGAGNLAFQFNQG